MYQRGYLLHRNRPNFGCAEVQRATAAYDETTKAFVLLKIWQGIELAIKLLVAPNRNQLSYPHWPRCTQRHG